MLKPGQHGLLLYNAPIILYGNPDRIGYTVPSRGSVQDNVFYNYKTKVQDLGIQGIVTLNNIRFHKQKTGIVTFTVVVVSVQVYIKQSVNALDANNNPYTALFNGITTSGYTNRKDILRKL